ncbi:hypothetical protein CLOBOL_02019 [Enterocloster bolteae ATCC BAA-613]|uniref:Uncharacterized protein n=1 Tax=Enterocloster bolteae (strain ATCC BAA-613 / DSM 15670 / CCUG 46953 / JCM 12243 / WAL 16351) TaxID=411902 RepID=A8RMT4_ENTBW|nr:hypothetical protein CLOBOL_02019 [Enterocloster bolteae ATCC BAA-613]
MAYKVVPSLYYKNVTCQVKIIKQVLQEYKKWREKALNLECLCKKWRMNSNI